MIKLNKTLKNYNKEFIKQWGRAESLSLDIYQQIANISDITGEHNENSLKYRKLKKKLLKLNNTTDNIILALEMIEMDRKNKKE